LNAVKESSTVIDMKIITLISLLLSLPLCADTTAPLNSYPAVPDEIVYAAYHDYKGCKLVKVEADGITISHNLGIAKLLFTQLPPDMRKAYGYDPDAAKKAMEDQATKDAASDAVAEKIRLAAVAKPAAQMAALASRAPIPAPRASGPSIDRQSIQSQIDDLQADIAFMQREESKVDSSNRLDANRRQVSHGAYADKIADEQEQVRQLQNQLASAN
jgi:hypothetical protein